jgi:nucleoside-diphosphate-sugar epimerase
MTVLVTGGTGYVAGWCIAELLRAGHEVRTTVRDMAKESAIRRALPGADDRLTCHVANLTDDGGWAAAMAGVDHVLHVASPLGTGQAGEDLITPAREGALRVLKAAAHAQVKRVVMTSSCAAATPPPGSTGEGYDETVWTDVGNQKFDTYRKSKAIAEKAAWDFMAAHDGDMTFTTVLPGAVFGPVLSKDTKGSVDVIGRLLRGMPGVPQVGFNVVDVRDLADLHVRAMTAAEAAGERFIAVGGFIWMAGAAQEIRTKLGADRVPTRTLPNLLVRGAALFDPSLRSITPMLGRKYVHTSAKAQKLLGWRPRSAEVTVVDCARSLIDHDMA